MKNRSINLTENRLALLEQWAREGGGQSVSSIIRWLIDREKERRDQERELIAGAQNPEPGNAPQGQEDETE